MTITEFGDFNCPAWKAWHEAGILEQIQEDYDDQVTLVWCDFPAISPQSPKAAELASVHLTRIGFGITIIYSLTEPRG